MPGGSTKFYTGGLTSVLALTAADLVIEISIYVVSGTVTVTGSAKLQGNASTPMTVPVGVAVTYTGTDSNSPIQKLTIDASAGSALITTKT